MKRLFILSGILSVVLLGSCIKNENPVFENPVVEFDAAAYNANAAGLTYPILTRVPGYGRPVSTGDPLLTRTSPGIKKFRVNLLGAQLTKASKVFYTVHTGTTAIEGVHYKKPAGEFTIAENSSFAEIEIEILNPGANTPATRDLVLLLTSGENEVKSSVNYNIIALRIAQ
jgi:hypothetical protein